MKYWLWLSAETGISLKAKAALLDYYGDAETAYFAPPGEFMGISGINAAEAAVLEKRDLSRCGEIMHECAMQNIQIISLADAAYPRRLKNIYSPPPVIYVKGRLPDIDEEAAVAIVGTRKASPYGLKMAGTLAYQTAKCGGIVISGLTHGIDAAAAKGALHADGVCIGVLGTSHEDEKGSLAKDVCVKGALISEYPPGTRAMKSFFRARNRISSALSIAVVAVEAPERSGTHLFVREALEQGKEVFAVPGNADAENSRGTISMLKDGAKPVTEAWDVLCEFEALFPGKIKKSDKVDLPENVENEAEKAETKPLEPKKVIDNEKNRGYIDLKGQLSKLSAEQLLIIGAIERSATHIDDIIDATGLSAAKVLGNITMLEIKGYIRREAGRRITLNTAKK